MGGTSHRRGRCLLGVLGLAWLVWPSVEAAEPAKVTIAAEGKSAYAIVTPDDADPARTGQAATLLQAVLLEATGVKLPVVKESDLPPDTPAFYLGKTKAAQKAGLPVDQVKGWAYLNQVKGRDVFLVGEDASAGIADRKDMEYLGTLKAVTAFLEDQAGVRFLLPGQHGRYVPKLGVLAVDAGMKASWTPRFEFVIGRAPRDKPVAVALNLFGRSPVVFSYGGHSYYDAVPAKEYGEKHPEYFALIGGKRVPGGNHLCIANPEVQELMLREMEKRLDLGYQWVELAQTDGYMQCGCEACAAIHADPGERTWIVHRKLAEEMRKRRPGKKVMIISYPPTHKPPKSFRDFPDNVVIQMCRYSPNDFEEWAPYGVDKAVYLYNWGHYHTPGFGPKRTPRYAVEQVRRFLKDRVRGLVLCGGFEGQGSFGFDGPSYYAFGKALGDPDREPKDLLAEYVNSAFGESAGPMRSFFTVMFDRLEVCSAFSRPNTPDLGIGNPFSSPEDFYCHAFPARLLDDMGRNLERAKAAATTERVKAHLRLLEIEFGYVRNLASIFHLYRAYRLDPNWKSFDLLAAQVEARKRLIESVYGGGQAGRIAGLPPPFGGAARDMVEAGGKNAATLTAPLNWDFAFLRQRNVLPGVGSKSVVAPAVEGIKLDGRLDEPAWQKAAFQEMVEISMGPLPNASRFKVGYDREAFYLGVECEFDRVDPLEALKQVGRDGPAYAQECVEIMLDPYGTRERHCQLAFNPVPDSMYDAKMAYIEDPYHPLYGKRDPSWNGDWQYAAFIDKARKCWTAEVRIPFATLEVPPAGPGTVWTMNVGRQEFTRGPTRPIGPTHSEPVLSLWSPNLETRSFHDRSTFGDVVFR